MTTSYDVETQSTGSAMPGRDSEGYQTWNPSVGLYHKAAKPKRESYGGIIGALQDNMVRSGLVVKAYPENFAGIIAAIQDLAAGEYRPGSDTGEKPPGGDINIDINTGLPEWIEGDTQNGQLWFDTRQGRLMVWVEDDWYQTNGADGLPVITDDGKAPDIEIIVPGQFWWDTYNQSLYIFDGEYQLADGSTTNNPLANGNPIWKLVVDASTDGLLQTTATLPLTVIGPRVTALEDYEYLPDLDLSTGEMATQKDFNEWIFQALVNLDVGLETLRPVLISDVPPPSDDPDNPLIAGQLWYDTETLELSIWYVDDDSAQWVPTSVAYAFDEQLAPLEAAIATETYQRERAIHHLEAKINDFDLVDNQQILELQTKASSVQEDIDQINQSINQYVTSQTFVSNIGGLINRVETLETATPDYSSLITKVEANAEHAAIQERINGMVTPAELQQVASTVPDVSSFVTATDITTAIENITTEYLPRSGGTVAGNLQIRKNDVSLPGVDFSGASHQARNAFKFTSNSSTQDAHSTFGTTAKPWEFAWDFTSEEDFCWIYNDTNKVFSITKEGPACSTLYLGDIGDNTNNGRVIHNKIDVKERLNTYQSAFESIRQAVSSSTDYNSLKSGLLTALANV